MKWLRELWTFLGKYQNASVRWLHLIVVLAVIAQILSSNGMHFDKATGAVPGAPLTWFSDWFHIVLGLGLIPITLAFIVAALRAHGLRHYYPYLWGDLAQAKADLAASLKLQLTEPRPGGLAAIVTGLGFGAIALALTTGALWFFLWREGSPSTHEAKEVHEAMATLVEVYFVGHGGMATLHFLAWLKQRGGSRPRP